MTDVTKAEALTEIRRYQELYPDAAPEVATVGLIRRADSWEEITTILAALDQLLAEDDQTLRDAQADASDRWADGYAEPEVQTGADELEYADESEYIGG